MMAQLLCEFETAIITEPRATVRPAHTTTFFDENLSRSNPVGRALASSANVDTVKIRLSRSVCDLQGPFYEQLQFNVEAYLYHTVGA